MTVPNIDITIADNGANAALTVPQNQVQVVIGVAAAGTDYVPVATNQPSTLQSNYLAGPLPEAAGLTCNGGGIAVAVKVPLLTKGTTSAVVATNTGGSTSVMTVTLDSGVGAYDDYFVMVQYASSGTIGTSASIQISLSAGREFGPPISLGTAVTYSIPNTGIILHFTAAPVVAGDYNRFYTTAPTWDSGSVVQAITTIAQGPYGLIGWGSMHLVGVTNAASTAVVQAKLDAIADKYIYTRCIANARDASPPVAWGGSGESQSTWENSLATNFSGTSADRMAIGAGNYNMPSVFPTQVAGTPSYRRPIGWADAQRRVQVEPQVKGGVVEDGALGCIVVNPSTDPGDGFIYFDSQHDPTLDAARFMTAMTWPRQQGYFICQENLMAGTGSQFTNLVYGNVIDIACDITYAEGLTLVNNGVTLNKNGTIFATDALEISSKLDLELAAGMVNGKMVSDAYSSVDTTNNVRQTETVKMSVTVVPLGYITTLKATINLST